MKSKSSENIDNQSGGTAAKISYSPEELAEVFMTSRPDFLILDLEEITLNWNSNYIFAFLKCIGNSEARGLVIEWMGKVWEDRNGFYSSYEAKVKLSQDHAQFVKRLEAINHIVQEWLDKKEADEQLRLRMLQGYCPDVPSVNPQEPVVEEKTQTSAPEFTEPTHEAKQQPSPYSVKLEDLPENIRKKVLVSQQVFDVYVRQLNEDLWLTVMTHKGKYCGCLFFLSNYNGITSRNTDAKEFAELMDCVVLELKGNGSIESSIRRRDETKEGNIQQSYKYYNLAEVNKNMEKKIFMLRNDCKVLLDGFQPVLDAMEEEKRQAQSLTDSTSVAA